MAKPEWKTQYIEYPNPTANCTRTFIRVNDAGLWAEYWHVEGGFKVNRHRSNAKLYTSEMEVRGVLLRKMLAMTRKGEREILSALESVQ